MGLIGKTSYNVSSEKKQKMNLGQHEMVFFFLIYEVYIVSKHHSTLFARFCIVTRLGSF